MKFNLLYSIFLLFIFVSCSTSSNISDAEIQAMREEIDFLQAKVDTLESRLEYTLDVEKMLEHDSLLFSIRKTPCLGNCPVYNFKVYKDGWASFEGKNFVDMLGVYAANLNYKQMERVKEIFREAHFYTFSNEYDDARLDIPSTIVEYEGPQGFKKVIARTEIPHTFRTMTVKLEELADEIKWYPIE